MRHLFGRTRADWVMEAGDPILAGETTVAYVAHMLPSQPITLWDQVMGGNQVTDLVDPDTGDSLGSSITTDGYGSIPRFLGPDGVTVLWASASVDGTSPRYAMTAVDVADAFTDVTTQLSALDSTVTDHGQRLTHLEQGRVHDVTTYGAVGDGAADDTAAIQAALDAVRTAGGGAVYVPGGTYSLQNGPLRIYANTRLTLAPDAVIRRDAGGTMLLNGDSDQVFGGYTGHGNIVIEGGTWDANGATVTQSNMALSIGHARGVTIRDLQILDVPGYHAVEINSTHTARVLNCAFRGFTDFVGDRGFSEAVQIDGAYRSSVFGGFGPYDHTVCQNVVVQGCYVGPSGTPGSTSWGRGIGSHSTAPDAPHRGIHIVDNTIDATTEYGIGAYCWSESTIRGNIITGAGAGIWLRSLDSSKTADQERPDGTSITGSQPLAAVVIADNTITDTGVFNDGILAEGESDGPVEGVTITGNLLRNISAGGAENGIRLIHVHDCSVGGNTLRDVAGTGISTESCDGLSVSGNRLRDVDGAGITVITSQTSCNVTGNTLRTIGGNALWAQGGMDVSFAANIAHGIGLVDPGAYAVRVTSGTDGITITGNRLTTGAGTVAGGISITSTCFNTHVYGNDCRYTGGISDAATNASASAGNLV